MLLVRIFAPFALGYFLSYLFRVVNAVIAPDLVRDIGLDAGALGLLTSAYFLTFAAFQLPLGILLDRFGPRKTEAALLVFAGVGALVFALAEGTTALIAGRALIGFGVSACLMAAFKAFVQWFPPERLALVNGLQLGAGGLGAVAATAPVERALQFTDWRMLFLALAALSLVTALAVLTVVPKRGDDKPPAPTGTSGMGHQLSGLAEVLKSPVFWSITPWATASQGCFLAVQSLWVGPWLRDVAGLDRTAVADVLFWIAVAMIAGFVGMGGVAERLARFGVRTIKVAVTGMVVFMAVQLALVHELGENPAPLWIAFGFFGTTGTLCYAALSQKFPSHLAGRVNTSINLVIFIAAFALQWAIGAVIDLYSEPGASGYAPHGYQVAFSIVLALQVAGAIWYLVAGLRGHRL